MHGAAAQCQEIQALHGLACVYASMGKAVQDYAGTFCCHHHATNATLALLPPTPPPHAQVPDPAPMTSFKGQPMTHELAEDLFIGWLQVCLVV